MDADANANADTGGSTIALRELCSSELKIGHLVTWPFGPVPLLLLGSTQSMWHGMVYDMAWRAWHGIWFMSARHGMVYSIAWRAWQNIWYGLADMELYMVMAWREWHGIWYGLGGHDVEYGIALQSLYNATHYNTVLVITQSGLGLQMAMFL